VSKDTSVENIGSSYFTSYSTKYVRQHFWDMTMMIYCTSTI